ncbi:PREDICTED: centrosomal protein of 295 kDa-like [Amphimedon queenslandica]|uniref:Uncharacterized protein n=1 Tax=Amphimedon queenslandica TaxID=400682 RepID=A0A1X7VQE2_AMPQE|nr:PREDICTED: centrosomal protein of 295 kDa-like [Amphimedon queenslandica]|eukprot:XP_011408325.1 PREDICTED: centrosomal protein of 295 kDa-like [Amphimedon queenslandica]
MSGSGRFKLSPSEQKALLQKEMRERRKIRLLQVREQEKEFARQMRNNVRLKKEEERKILEQHIKDNLVREHEEKLRQLEETLTARRQQVGQAQRDAQNIEQEERRLQELRLLLSSQQRALAKKRQALAMQELIDSQLMKRAEKDNSVLTRNQALATEKERAKLMSTRKLKTPSLLIMDLEANPSSNFSTRRVQGVEGFASTYFHLPDNLVHREATATPYEINAIQAAEQALMEEEEHQRQQTVMRDEQQVKAQLRHKHALAQVKLEKDKTALLKDLSLLAREDRTHRQEILQHLPTNLFQPVQQRIEEREMRQYELEHEFEKLLTKTRQTSMMKSVEIERKGGGRTAGGATEITLPGRDSCSPSPVKSDNMSTTHCTPPPPPPPIATKKDPLDLTIQSLTPSTFQSMSITEPREKEGNSKGRDPNNEDEEEEGPSLTISTIRPPKDTTTTSSTSQSTNISKLVGLIRTQQDAWYKRSLDESSPSNDVSSVSEARGEEKTSQSLSISALSSSHQGPLDSSAHNTTATSPATSRDIDKATSTSSSSPSPSSSPPELTIETIEETEEEEDNSINEAPLQQPAAYYPIYYYPTAAYQQQHSSQPTPAMMYTPLATYPPPVVYTQYPTNQTLTSSITIPPPSLLQADIRETDDRTISPDIKRSSTEPFEPPLLYSEMQSHSVVHSTVPENITTVPVATHSTSPTTQHNLSLMIGGSGTVPGSNVTHSPHVRTSPDLSLTLSPHTPPVIASANSSTPVASEGDRQERNEFIQSLLVSLQDSRADSPEESPLPVQDRAGSSVNTTPLLRSTSVQTNVLIHSPPSPSLSSSLSLQEAFKSRKQSFIKQSQTRVSDIGKKSKERVNQTKKSKSAKLVTFSSPVLQEERENAIKHTPPSIHKGSSWPAMPSKVSSREAQEKNRDDQRQKENREKAKLFCQMLRNKIKQRQDSS